MRKSNRNQAWLDLLKNLYNDSQITKQTDFPPGYNTLFSCFRRFEIRGPLSKNGELDNVYNKKKVTEKEQNV